MSTTHSITQRTAVALSAPAPFAAFSVASPADPMVVVANGSNVDGSTGHVNPRHITPDHIVMAWLGGVAETGCVKNTYGAKRITPDGLCEGLT